VTIDIDSVSKQSINQSINQAIYFEWPK